MNYLGHLLLSGACPDRQVGGLLGDFVKGPLAGKLPARIEEGITLHRRIDALCQDLAPIHDLIKKTHPNRRRYAGIVIDIAFDHQLARQWLNYHPLPLADYCREFYQHLARRRSYLPLGARDFCTRAPQIRWLESYADPDSIVRVLLRISQCRKVRLPLCETWRDLKPYNREIGLAFSQSMVTLDDFARRQIRAMEQTPIIDSSEAEVQHWA